MEGTEAVHPHGIEGPRSREDPDRTCHTGGDTGREQLTASECESDYYLFGLFRCQGPISTPHCFNNL